MKPKAYLNQVSRLERSIQQIEEQIKEIRETKASAGAIRYDKANVQTSPDDTMADYVARLDELERKAFDLMDKKIRLRLKITEQIDRMPNNLHALILSDRYICGMSLVEIAEDLNYSYEYIVNTHGRALKMFGELYLDKNMLGNVE